MSVRTIERVRAGKPVSTDSRTKLTHYTVRRARSLPRELGIVERPGARSAEGVLSSFLEHFGERLCECGCDGR
jgi:hypothetical protein